MSFCQPVVAKPNILYERKWNDDYENLVVDWVESIYVFERISLQGPAADKFLSRKVQRWRRVPLSP